MPTGYCGMNCDHCQHRQALSCPGCQQGPGRAVFGDCVIALCCRGRHLSNCGQCQLAPECGKLAGCCMTSVNRLQKRQQDAQKEEALAKNGPKVGRKLRLIFWLYVVMLVGIMLLEVAMWIPAVSLVGYLVRDGAAVAIGIVLLGMGFVSNSLRVAGWFLMFSGLARYLMTWCGDFLLLYLLLLVDSVVLEIVGEHQQLQGYAGLMEDVDAARADAWRMMWKWYLTIQITQFVCQVMLLIIPSVAATIYALALMAQMILYVLKLVYLRKSAEMFHYR